MVKSLWNIKDSIDVSTLADITDIIVPTAIKLKTQTSAVDASELETATKNGLDCSRGEFTESEQKIFLS